MHIDFSSIKISFLSNDSICAQADLFRQKHWGEKIPVDVELIAEKKLGLLMIPLPNLRSKVHTEAFLSGDLKEIVYDPNSPEVRMRFSTAHEIGHLVLHADAIRKLRVDTVEEWKEMQRGLPDALWGRAEYQAREFAGRLLVPLQQLKEALIEIRPLIQKALDISPDLEIAELRELISPKLAKKFFVSDQVVLHRMEAEDLSPIQ